MKILNKPEFVGIINVTFANPGKYLKDAYMICLLNKKLKNETKTIFDIDLNKPVLFDTSFKRKFHEYPILQIIGNQPELEYKDYTMSFSYYIIKIIKVEKFKIKKILSDAEITIKNMDRF